MKRVLTLILALLLTACFEGSYQNSDDLNPPVITDPEPVPDPAPSDNPNPNPPDAFRGLRWVRNNPMFISALNVSMGAPTAAQVATYYNQFGATATHLWMDGLPDEMDAWIGSGQAGHRFVSWTQPNGTSLANGRIIGGYAAGAAGRIGYQIGDEPGLACQDLACAMADLQDIEVGVNAVRARDGDALIIVNFNRNDFDENLLEYYCEMMDGDIISYSHYNRGESAYETLETFRRYGLRYDKPYWRYLKAYYQTNNRGTITESDMRWNAFSGLLYGYTGQTWFLYNNSGDDPLIDPALFSAEGNYDAPFTDLWSIAAQINAEMRNLGRALTQMTSTAVRYIPAFSFLQPRETNDWRRGAGDDIYITGIRASDDNALLDISIGFFKDDLGEIYFMVQNVNHTNGDFPVNLGGTETIEISFDFSSAPETTQRAHLLTVNKLTGNIERIGLSWRDGDSGRLDVRLAAGDVILLKYDTGAPFAYR